jgi:hypothetical protein
LLWNMSQMRVNWVEEKKCQICSFFKCKMKNYFNVWRKKRKKLH